MCPNCPHCAESDMSCQDALGSSVEIMGGLAGRGDALFGGVECQKTTNSLHIHLWFCWTASTSISFSPRNCRLLATWLGEGGGLEKFHVQFMF